MKVVILAGGLGTRFSEETSLKPKPMIEIGGKPILWHIMKMYAKHGFNEFIVCLGYKGYVVKEFFFNYYMHQSDMIVNLSDNSIEFKRTNAENWKIHLIDTGMSSMTGARIKKIEDLITEDKFALTYGDGVSDLDISELVKFHDSHGGLATLTSVQPEGRFGALDIDQTNKVVAFREKPKGDGSWINGGFFILNRSAFKYLNNSEDLVFEQEPLQNLAKDGNLYTYKHEGFWKCMDTLRDKNQLEEMWSTNPKWKTW